MALTQKLVVDEAKVKKAILSGLPLTVTTFTLPREMEDYIESIIAIFLKQTGQEALKDYMGYCVRELAVNAKKANTKRVYFIENGLNISDPEDYRKGMEEFKETTLGNIEHFIELQKEMGLYIKLVLQIRENIINIEIYNNAAITRAELIRIHDRLARSRQYNSLEDALSHLIDDSEGAGLGLVILALMLKKIGLDDDCFDIHGKDNETIARIMIPMDRVQVEKISSLSREIANSVSSLPQFPENIMEVQRLLANPRAEMGSIAKHLSADPALTADLLRLVNSAHYMLLMRVDNIFDAVKLVGFRGIRNLLYSYGTQKILGEDTPEKWRLWEHSRRAAFYGYNLAKNFKKDHHLPDDVYVGSILHDMGKIVFSSAHPDLLDNIRHFCEEKDISVSTFEDIAGGMNHSEIGALIAKKWNFPDFLISAIRYHHSPSAAPEADRDLVDCVYLSNMMCEYENGAVTFDQFEEGPLANYGIPDKIHLDGILERLAEGFKNESEK